jgi:hypothetical protein
MLSLFTIDFIESGRVLKSNWTRKDASVSLYFPNNTWDEPPVATFTKTDEEDCPKESLLNSVSETISLGFNNEDPTGPGESLHPIKYIEDMSNAYKV